jgi:uncharacterized membrane protein YciS (DUF1049 family)
MSDALVLVAGVVVSALVILTIVRISMRITNRKSTDELKRARQASDSTAPFGYPGE